jgi:hypothetical protein
MDLESLIAGTFRQVLSRSPGPRGRVTRAVLGWLPLLWLLASALGELSGCARSAPSCTDQAVAISSFVALAPLPILLAAPSLAGLAAAGALALLLLALPLGAIVILFLGQFDPARSDVLAVFLTAAFVSGVVIGVAVRRGAGRGARAGGAREERMSARSALGFLLPAAAVAAVGLLAFALGAGSGGVRLTTASAGLIAYGIAALADRWPQGADQTQTTRPAGATRTTSGRPLP